MTPVERMARATAFEALDEELQRAVDMEAHMHFVREHHTRKAHAALKAIREPSKAMIEAGRIPTREIDLGNGTTATGLGLGADPESIWKRMIDAALSET